MGKKKIQGRWKKSYTWIFPPAALFAAACLAACAGGDPGPFAGSLRPTAGTCDPPGRAVLTIADSYVHFTPREGVITLDGRIAPNGAIEAQLASTTPDRHPYTLRCSGQMKGDKVTGTFVTPRCTYEANLSSRGG